jgi:predicted transcriptional regulator
MAEVMIYDVTLMGLSFVISFIITLIFYDKKVKSKNEISILQSTISEQLKRQIILENEIKMLRDTINIADQKFDLILLNNHLKNKNSNELKESHDTHTSVVTMPVTYEQNNHNTKSHNGTVEYILKLLNTKQMTSREIQKSIGRTREHTARLMKKLYQLQLVDRNMSNKPFTYSITEEGRKQLKGLAETTSVKKNDALEDFAEELKNDS